MAMWLHPTFDLTAADDVHVIGNHNIWCGAGVVALLVRVMKVAVRKLNTLPNTTHTVIAYICNGSWLPTLLGLNM